MDVRLDGTRPGGTGECPSEDAGTLGIDSTVTIEEIVDGPTQGGSSPSARRLEGERGVNDGRERPQQQQQQRQQQLQLWLLQRQKQLLLWLL